MLGNSITNSNTTASNSSFVQYHQNQLTTNSTTNYLSNNHLNGLNNQQTSSNFHSNRYNNSSTSNSMPVSATSMLMNGRLMFNDLNSATNSVNGSNSTCSNSTINSLEETIIKKPTGKCKKPF